MLLLYNMILLRASKILPVYIYGINSLLLWMCAIKSLKNDHLTLNFHWKSPWCWERLRTEGEKGVRGWDGEHHWCNDHELRQTPGDREAQGGLARCSPRGHSQTRLGGWTTTTLNSMIMESSTLSIRCKYTQCTHTHNSTPNTAYYYKGKKTEAVLWGIRLRYKNYNLCCK